LAIIGATVILVPFMAEYQQERLVSYFNPDKDTSGSSYNVLQAGIAIGSGGLTGNGISSGTQSQLNFLPSQHTDFIFAVTAEKLGLIGAMSVIVAFALIIMRTSHLAWATTNQYERGLLVGIAATLFFHIFVNIGMNLGLVPVTGLPLPLLSYGGTFMFVSIFALGIVVIISNNMRMRSRNSLSIN
jgi:rod shape determining protein RodA